jgi:hypothetical protein
VSFLRKALTFLCNFRSSKLYGQTYTDCQLQSDLDLELRKSYETLKYTVCQIQSLLTLQQAIHATTTRP